MPTIRNGPNTAHDRPHTILAVEFLKLLLVFGRRVVICLDNRPLATNRRDVNARTIAGRACLSMRAKEIVRGVLVRRVGWKGFGRVPEVYRWSIVARS